MEFGISNGVKWREYRDLKGGDKICRIQKFLEQKRVTWYNSKKPRRKDTVKMEEMGFKGRDLSERGKRNLIILEAIRRSGLTTKAEVSKVSGLNIVTVSNYINDFVRRKLILEKELAVSSGGRRPIMVELNPKAGFVMGVGIDLLNMVGVLTDLQSNVLVRVKRERPHNEGRIVEQMIELVEELLKKSELTTEKIKGLGLGIPGIINRRTGTIRWPEQMGTIDIAAVESLIEQRFGVPTFVDNDANLAAFGEHWLKVEPETKNILFMYSGVGCGIVVNGQIYRGTTGSAGELGIYSLEENNLKQDAGLRRWEIDLGITREVKRAISEGTPSKILELANGNIEGITLTLINEAGRKGDALANRLIKEAGVSLGKKIAYLVNFLNPEVVIIGGGIERLGPTLLEAIKTTVRKWAFDEIVDAVKIIPTQLGEDSVALGAASLVVQEIFVRS